ncbi:MAG: AAA family ATPase [Bacillota bacterium]
MRHVVFQRMTLRGFGCYRREKIIELQEGLNIYIAPNEDGKSTLVAGFLAVLFGLPGSSDPTKFGKARYLNWEGAQEFEGELVFTVHKTTYRITRDFATDRVSLACLEKKGWVELAGGEHRSRARRQNVSYTETLTGLIGIASTELFNATFCLTQPLPRADSLDADIVRLLTGAAGSYRNALDNLSVMLKQLTKYTRDRGVASGNQRQDRRLEILASEINLLVSSLENHRHTLDDLPAVKEELSLATVRHQELSGRLATKGNALHLWGDWRNLRQRYQTLLGEQDRMQQALLKARALGAQEEALIQEIAAEYPELKDYPADMRASLSSLKELQDRIIDSEKTIDEMQSTLEEYQAEMGRLKMLLDRDYAHVDGRDELLQQHGELFLLLRQQEELMEKLARAREKAVSAEATTAGLRLWGSLGSRPTTILQLRQRVVADLLQEWTEYLRDLKQMEVTCKELEMELSWFEQASTGAREACRNYAALRTSLVREREQAQEALDRNKASIKNYQEEEHAFHQEFGLLVSIEGAGVQAMESKLSLLAQERALDDSMSTPKTRKDSSIFRQPLVWINAGAIAVLAVFKWPLALMAAALAGGIWLVMGIKGYNRDKKTITRLVQDLERVRRLLDELNSHHSFLASWGEQDLIRAQERSRLCQRQKEALGVRRQRLPAAEELTRLELLLGRAKMEEERFRDLTREACRQFPDVARSYNRWEEVRGRKDKLEIALIDWRNKEFGNPAPTVEDCPLDGAGERWKEAAEVATVSGVQCRTAGELATWMTGLDSHWWQRAMGEAREWEKVQEELKRARETEQGLTEPEEDGGSPMAMLAEKIVRSRHSISPFDETTGQADLQGRLDGCRLVRADLLRVETLAGSEEGRLRNLRAELEEWQTLKRKVETNLSAFLAVAGGEAGLALARWDDFCRRKGEAERFSENLRALLAAHGATAMEDLRIAAIDVSNRTAAVLTSWEKLVADHPGLPGAHLGESIDDAYNSLQAEVEGLTREVEEAKQREDHLRTRQAELQGIVPLNLAEGGERLDELRKEKQRVELEVEALALAYQELQVAAQEFQSGHRDKLAQRSNDYFNRLSGVTGRRVVIDEDFHISLALETGQQAAITQLSQGAQDQLYLALRLAVADLLSGDLILPFIFDDPFLNFDEQRLAHAGQAVRLLSNERQVLLFTHRREFSAWQSEQA